jgi:hypothetical protein
MAPPYDPELTDLFRGIRDLPINWPAIVAASSRVSLINLSRTGSLTPACIFVAWYTRNGEPVSLPEKGVLPVTLEQAATSGFSHLRMFENVISRYIQQGRFNWTLPAYDVERGYLLLNGVHRSIATLRANDEYNIRLAVIHGPIDNRVLADLIVFERP